MKTLYLKIHEVFGLPATKKQYTDKGVTPINTIDLYAGQDFDAEYFEANLFPALFLSWKIEHENKSSVADLSVRIAYEQLRDISNIGRSKAKGLQFFDLISLTDITLRGIQTETTGRLSLVSESLELQPTVVDVYTLKYECSYCGRSEFQKTETQKEKIEKLRLSKTLKQHF